MYDVITVGSAIIDAFVNTENKLFKGKQGHIKVPFGSKILISDLNFQVGGGGTNTAVAFSRLGLKTAYLGKVGLGTNSSSIFSLLKKEKVSTDLIIKSNERTGFSIILDAKGKDRTILKFGGANDNLRFNEIKHSKLRTRWFYFSSMMGRSLKTLRTLSDYAVKNHIGVMFNPSVYLIKKNKYQVKKILKNCAVTCMNQEEADLLVGNNSLEKQLLKLSMLGPDIVIITNGKKGVYCYAHHNFYYVKPHHIKVVETTGAGDAFGSGFLAGYIKKKDIELALRLGLVNAESIIQHYGAKTNLLTWKKAKVFLEKRTKIKKW